MGLSWLPAFLPNQNLNQNHGTDMEVMVGTAANAVKQTLTPLLNQKLSHITTMVTIHTTLDTITSARDLLKPSQKASHGTDMVDMVMEVMVGTAANAVKQTLTL